MEDVLLNKVLNKNWGLEGQKIAWELYIKKGDGEDLGENF